MPELRRKFTLKVLALLKKGWRIYLQTVSARVETIRWEAIQKQPLTLTCKLTKIIQ